jgi:surface-anchored protein
MNITSRLLPLLAALAAAATAPAQTNWAVLTNEHADLRFLYQPAGSNLLELVARDEDRAVNLAATNVALVVDELAETVIPANANFAFLGPAGAPIWILPQSQDPDLLFLGVSAEDIAGGVFNGGLNLTLKSVDARGHFFAWQSGSFGSVTVRMNSRDGITTNDTLSMGIGSHGHFNWGFSTNGIYRVTFQGSGRRVGETTNITSPDTSFVFLVHPLRPFESWLTTHWPWVGPVTLSGPDADPDGDSIRNLHEYAYGTDPTQAGVDRLPQYFLTNIAGVAYGALAYTRNKSATDIALVPEAAAQPGGPWEPMTNLLGVVDLGAVERVTVRDATALSAAGARYARLRVTLLP